MRILRKKKEENSSKQLKSKAAYKYHVKIKALTCCLQK